MSEYLGVSPFRSTLNIKCLQSTLRYYWTHLKVRWILLAGRSTLLCSSNTASIPWRRCDTWKWIILAGKYIFALAHVWLWLVRIETLNIPRHFGPQLLSILKFFFLFLVPVRVWISLDVWESTVPHPLCDPVWLWLVRIETLNIPRHFGP